MKNKDIKILLVDDDADILEIVGFNLEAENYQVYTAKNGREALTIANKEPPNLVTLHLMMPEIDAIETCEHMRKLPEINNTMITFLRARGEDYSQLAGFGVGADDYITNPIK